MARDETYGRIEISGGTVHAYGGYMEVEGGDDYFAADIGDGLTYSQTYYNNNAVVITGGNVVLSHFNVEEARFTQSNSMEENLPHDAAGRVVYPVVVDVGAANREVAFSGLDGYGTGDIWSDDDGKVYLWLPAGSETPTPVLMSARRTLLRRSAAGAAPYHFVANGRDITATVAEGGAVEVASEPLPLESLRIDGFEVRDGAIAIRYTAKPETWLYGFRELIGIRASNTLPFTDGGSWLLDLSDAELTLEGDDAATVVVPLAPGGQGMFFKVEGP